MINKSWSLEYPVTIYLCLLCLHLNSICVSLKFLFQLLLRLLVLHYVNQACLEQQHFKLNRDLFMRSSISDASENVTSLKLQDFSSFLWDFYSWYFSCVPLKLYFWYWYFLEYYFVTWNKYVLHSNTFSFVWKGCLLLYFILPRYFHAFH